MPDLTERQKRDLDMFTYGTGVLHVADDGTEKHIPLEDLRLQWGVDYGRSGGDHTVVSLRQGLKLICTFPDGYTDYRLLSDPLRVIVTHRDKPPMWWSEDKGWRELKFLVDGEPRDV